jgi:hypothetical protein
MAAVGPQGSRGGLLAAVVVFTILFVTATIFAIYFGVDDSKKTEALQVQLDKAKLTMSGADMQTQRYQALTKQATQTRPPKTILQMSFADSQNLADVIAGKHASHAADPMAAAAAATKAVTDADAKINGRNPGTLNLANLSLVDAINKLSAYAADQQYQNSALRVAQAAAAGDAVNQIKQLQQEVDSAKADLTAANKVKDAALDAQHRLESEYQVKVKDMSLAMDGERQKMNGELQKSQQAQDALTKELDAATREQTKLIAKLGKIRVSPIDPLLRQPDGYIVSVASPEIVYINLGMGDHIVPGMTFEVYSRREGIPKQSDLMQAEEMPVGLGSIEVENVLASAAECRVIKTEIGQHFSEGDLIANLVYDRNTKYNMMVYGNFDLAQTGKPKKGDRQKIEALITQWGGTVQNKINEDTDFVIMGKEPTIEQFTPEELQDPLNKQTQDDEKAEHDAYEGVLEKAAKLGIPIMNQNRFLYFCGYYDNAQR